MPCTFAGVFLVSQIENSQLICSFRDDVGDIHQVNINYYFPTNIERPFPEAYEAVQPGHVYFITGFFALADKDPIVYTLTLSILTLDASNIDLSSATIHSNRYVRYPFSSLFHRPFLICFNTHWNGKNNTRHYRFKCT